MEFGINGPSYTARSSSIADEECINLYVETNATNGKKSSIYTPGLDLFAALPQSPTRGSLTVGARLYAVAGAGLYEVKPNGAYTLIANVPNDGNAVSMASNGLQVALVTGGRMFCYTIATNTLLDVTAQLAAIPMQVQYSDTYLVVAFKNSPLFQISAVLAGTTWPGIQVNQVSVFPENIASIMVNHRELWVFGSRHTQPYQDTGSAEVFDVSPSPLVETGAVGAFSPCLLDNSIFWIGEDDRGGRMAWRWNGTAPARISTFAVEVDLASYPTLAGMTSYAYQDSGHLFWVLYIPGSQWSWVYDVSEQMWHKRSSLVNGVQSAHLSWNHAYAFGLHLVGDCNSGNLYAMSQNAFTDNGATIRRVRRSPTLSDEMQFIRHSELILDFDMGNISTVSPTNKPAFAASLLGPSPGTQAVDTQLTGAAWSNVGNVLVNDGNSATVQLTPVVESRPSSTSVGSSTGGGVAWTTPENIDSVSSFATVSLSPGTTSRVDAISTATLTNSATPSNTSPPNTYRVLTGLASTAATNATIYAEVSGSVVASSGGGGMSLYYSTDSGVNWTLVASYSATFAKTTIQFTVSGIANLSTIQLKMMAGCGCSPSGFSNVSFTVSKWYAILPGTSQPTAQTLVAAVTGLTVPDGVAITGVGLSFNADYVGDAPTFLLGLNVGTTDPAFTLTTTPAIYTAGPSLFGYTEWTPDTLRTLKINFSASSTGTTTVNVNQLVVTAYYTEASLPSDAIDITKFGFAVAPTATTKGITAVVPCFANVSGAVLTAQLLKAGVPAGVSETLPIPTTPSLLTFGGIAELFQTDWHDYDLNADGFGIRLTANTSTGNATEVSVGYSTLELYSPATVQNQTYIGPDPVLVDGNGNPRPPQVMVRWTDDRGKSWSNQHLVDCGMLGDYTARARISRLGRGRYRIYEVSMTDAIPWILIGGYLEAGR